MRKYIIFFIVAILALVWLFPVASTLLTTIKTPEQFRSIFFWESPPLTEILRNLIDNIIEAQNKTKILYNIETVCFTLFLPAPY